MRRCRICNAALGTRIEAAPVLAIEMDTTDDLIDNPVVSGDPLDPRCYVHAPPVADDDGDGG